MSWTHSLPLAPLPFPRHMSMQETASCTPQQKPDWAVVAQENSIVSVFAQERLSPTIASGPDLTKAPVLAVLDPSLLTETKQADDALKAILPPRSGPTNDPNGPRDLEIWKLNQQLHLLNNTLEVQVRERTAQLEKTLEFEALLRRISDKVRDSLNEDQILQTVVQEVGHCLNALSCNVGIYDIEKGTSTIAYEYASSLSSNLGNIILMASDVDTYGQLLRGQSVQACWLTSSFLRDLSEQNSVKLAYPLTNDRGILGDLWVTRSCERVFDEQEVRLVQQVAGQCAIAIRQSRLHQATQAQVAELERLNRLKDDFVSTISHELRTPLASMLMAIRMLQISEEDPFLRQKRQDYLDLLDQECRREISLIDDLLDLQSLEAVSFAPNPEPIDLNSWIPNLIAQFEEGLQERCLQMELCLSDPLPTAHLDRYYLDRILRELLINAIKYTPAGGCLRLLVQGNRKSGFEFILSNSVEIPSVEISRIFDKFYRVPQADRWQCSGTGLGLALVRRLAEALQGSITAESQDGWTHFSLWLPVAL